MLDLGHELLDRLFQRVEDVVLKILDFVLIEADEELEGGQFWEVYDGVLAGRGAPVTPEASLK